MATVIRSPRVNDHPRKLKKEVGVELNDDLEKAEAILPEQHSRVEVEEIAGPYEPEISPEDVAELRHKAEVAEERAGKAERAMAMLREELEKCRAEAREQGYAAGYEESCRKADAEYRENLEVIERISQGFLGRLDNLVAESEDLIVETIYVSVLKIIGEQLIDKDSIAKMVRHVADQLIHAENFVVRLSPSDCDLLKKSRKKLFPENEPASVRLVPDNRVELGGCILESAGGSLDARLEVQLSRLKEVLLSNRALRQNELSSGI